jgi:hypothetical protein
MRGDKAEERRNGVVVPMGGCQWCTGWRCAALPHWNGELAQAARAAKAAEAAEAALIHAARLKNRQAPCSPSYRLATERTLDLELRQNS